MCKPEPQARLLAAVVVVSALVLTRVPRFANTRESAQLAAASGERFQASYALAAPPGYAPAGAPAARVAGFSAPATDAVAGIIRLPSATHLMAEVPADTNRLLIRTGEMQIEVDSLEPGVTGVAQVARAVGGFVANTSTQTTESAAPP